MEREVYENCLKELKEGAVEICENGLRIVRKECSDREKGCMDPRAWKLHTLKREEAEENPEKLDTCLKKNMHYLFPGPQLPGESMTAYMRRTMGWDNEDITSGSVCTEEVSIQGRNGRIPLRIYRPFGGGSPKPCLIFFHGGGFTGGSPDVVENPCKAVADRADAVVISVDYRLAPEHPYPAGLEDCMDAVEWTLSQAERLHINPGAVGVGGDSAGGCLAAACVYLDRLEGKNKIAFQVLLYPTVTRSADSLVNGFTWNMEAYENRENNPGIRRALTWMMDTMDGLNRMYLGDLEKITDPGASPLLHNDFTGWPYTLMITAEYDYLRLEDEAYVKRLLEAGVTARLVRYGGMEHAFLDKCGYYPQAEDCIDEIAGAVRRYAHV